MNEWISRQRAAELAGVSLRTLDRWVRAGYVTADKQPGRRAVRIDTASLKVYARI